MCKTKEKLIEDGSSEHAGVIDPIADKVSKCIEIISLGNLLSGCFKKTEECRRKAVDSYVLLKVFLAGVLLFSGVCYTKNVLSKTVLLVLSIYLIIETLNSLFRKILYPDSGVQPNYRRASLLLFLNWVEIIFLYAVMYWISGSIVFESDGQTSFDYFYFSFLHTVTMDMDGASLVGSGRCILIAQVVTFVMFLTLFLSHNFGRIK